MSERHVTMRSDEPRQAASRAALGTLALLLACLGGAGLLGPRDTGRTLSAEEARLRLDPNTATRDELMLLPGIGEKLSAQIIAHRQAVARPPAFTSAADLAHVRRIGPVRVEKLRPYLRFGPQPPATPGTAP
jgi:transposase